uniref:Uncharacterized protein n=1 Tax=Strigamia maritima TaxID=126957 RepID=T1IIB3_STRMM
MEKTTLSAAKRPLDIVVNILGRLFIWLLLMGVALFSGMQLRVIPMHSFINCVISGCSFGNFVLLLHTSGTILTDSDNYGQTPNQQPGHRRQSHGVVVRMSIGVWTVIIQMTLAGCRALHLASHLWPLADTMLVSCLVALGVYMARRSLDEAWFSSTQVQHARIVAQESRHLIWPVVLLLINYVCDVIMSILRLTQEYALRFLISVSNIGNEKNRLIETNGANNGDVASEKSETQSVNV